MSLLLCCTLNPFGWCIYCHQYLCKECGVGKAWIWCVEAVHHRGAKEHYLIYDSPML